MNSAVVLQKQPNVVDFYDPFFGPALGILAAAVFAPW